MKDKIDSLPGQDLNAFFKGRIGSIDIVSSRLITDNANPQRGLPCLAWIGRVQHADA